MRQNPRSRLFFYPLQNDIDDVEIVNIVKKVNVTEVQRGGYFEISDFWVPSWRIALWYLRIVSISATKHESWWCVFQKAQKTGFLLVESSGNFHISEIRFY